MQTKMGAGPLLDARGRLAETGWATAEVRRYDRAQIAAGKLRIKEWDYYCILADAFGIALTVADNGYLGFLGVSWMDLAAGTAVSYTHLDVYKRQAPPVARRPSPLHRPRACGARVHL